MNGFNNKDDLEKALLVGIHGAPELHREEKQRFLGFFRERVIEALSFDQLDRKGLAVMAEALADKRAVELVIHRSARRAAMPLIVEARKKGLDFTIVSDPKFTGEAALVLVADHAVDIPRLLVEKEKSQP
ncbi:MAG: YueI family protein [Firmicutes bacterium]|nr:YueI family protein [Bacillota bacterium]